MQKFNCGRAILNATSRCQRVCNSAALSRRAVRAYRTTVWGRHGMLDDRHIALGVVAVGLGAVLLISLIVMRRYLLNGERPRGKEEQNFFRPLGYVARPITYIGLLLTLYFYAPRSVLSTPLASLTLGDIFGWFAWLSVGVLIVMNFFQPSEDDEIKDLWGVFGVLILFCGFIYFVYVRPDFIASLVR